MPYYFAYGSNSVHQLGERLGLTTPPKAYPALLRDYTRIFAGYGRRWGGGVATILPERGGTVYGTVVCLDEDQFRRLDTFEHTDSKDPHSHRGYYRRERVRIRVYHTARPRPCWAYTYILNTPVTTHTPTEDYLAACYRNLTHFWDIPYLEVRDHRLHLKQKWRPKK